MLKAIFKHNFFIAFAIAFAIPVVIMGIIVFGNCIDASIANNGIEAIGYIIPDSYESNLMVNNVDYYHIDYYFLDEDGNTYDGQTSDTYLYSEIMDIIDVGYVRIKYDPNTLESIESTYTLFDDPGFWGIMIGFLIFVLADGAFWVVSIRTILNNLALDKVEKSGTEYDAIVTHISSNYRVNGVYMFKVHYTWKNEMGQECTGSSVHKYVYYQAKALENVKNIRIRAIGTKSCIVTNPDSISIDNDESIQQSQVEQYYDVEQNVAPNTVKQEYCDFCAQKLSPEDDTCPNCGAKIHH